MSDAENNCSSPKKLKIDEKQTDESLLGNLKSLSDFKPDEILSNNSLRKTICLKGTFKNQEGVGIVLLEKFGFNDSDFLSNTQPFDENTPIEKDFHNDIYANYKLYPKYQFNGIKSNIVYPATKKHIEKYSTHKVYLVNETCDVYKNITLPHLLKEQFSIQWVYNILSHKKESERIVYEDEDSETGFILLPDMKWTDDSPETLYLQAIVHKRGIKSIRDLTAEHLPLLKNILENGTKAIKEKYGLNESQLRIYLHYQPSFYHLHVHFMRFNYESMGAFTEKAHLLVNVISNLELLSDYYQRVTLPYAVSEHSNLFKTFIENKVLETN